MWDRSLPPQTRSNVIDALTCYANSTVPWFDGRMKVKLEGGGSITIKSEPKERKEPRVGIKKEASLATVDRKLSVSRIKTEIKSESVKREVKSEPVASTSRASTSTASTSKGKPSTSKGRVTTKKRVVKRKTTKARTRKRKVKRRRKVKRKKSSRAVSTARDRIAKALGIVRDKRLGPHSLPLIKKLSLSEPRIQASVSTISSSLSLFGQGMTSYGAVPESPRDNHVDDQIPLSTSCLLDSSYQVPLSTSCLLDSLYQVPLSTSCLFIWDVIVSRRFRKSPVGSHSLTE